MDGKHFIENWSWILSAACESFACHVLPGCVLPSWPEHVTCTFLLACYIKVMWVAHLLEVSSWKGNDITSWEGKCDSAHHMSHTDLKLLSFLADSSPAVSTVIYYLVLFLVELIHLRNKKEKFIEKERKKEREICEENQWNKSEKKNQIREVSLHDPFSLSHDFNQCVMVWLRVKVWHPRV